MVRGRATLKRYGSIGESLERIDHIEAFLFFFLDFLGFGFKMVR